MQGEGTEVEAEEEDGEDAQQERKGRSKEAAAQQGERVLQS
jgi:hypothetical protein